MTADHAPPRPSGTVAVELRGASVDHGRTRALDGVDLVVPAGERVALVGPSGAGKSTLLALCRGGVRPTRGVVRVLGHDVDDLGPSDLRRLRRRIATVHQQLHLVGRLRVVHNVNAGRLGTWTRRRALWSLVRPQEVADARRVLAAVGVADKLLARTDSLSGGERQRVAVARALVQDPHLVLADEPISSLDPARGREVMDLLGRVAASGNRTLLVSLHDFEMARATCSRVVGLREGRVWFDLPAHQVTPGVGAALYRIDAGA